MEDESAQQLGEFETTGARLRTLGLEDLYPCNYSEAVMGEIMADDPMITGDQLTELATIIWNLSDAMPEHTWIAGDRFGPEYITLTSCNAYNKHGHIASRWYDSYGNGPTIKLGINFSWWKNQTNERRITFLVHEIAHAHVSNHPPEFWTKYIELLNEFIEQIQQQPDLLRHHFGDVDAHEIKSATWDSVNPTIIDRRSNSVEEIRHRVDDEIVI